MLAPTSGFRRKRRKRSSPVVIAEEVESPLISAGLILARNITLLAISAPEPCTESNLCSESLYYIFGAGFEEKTCDRNNFWHNGILRKANSFNPGRWFFFIWPPGKSLAD